VTDKIFETLGMRAHAKGLELVVHLMPDVRRELRGDPQRLRQILINLIGNAIKFTETGQVLLSIERDPSGGGPGALLFTVSDTGIGIASDKLDAVFANFTQADSSDQPPPWWQRAWPRDRQASGCPDGRPHLGRERGGGGQRVSLYRTLRGKRRAARRRVVDDDSMLRGIRALVTTTMPPTGSSCGNVSPAAAPR
jgi:hypothetical protein